MKPTKQYIAEKALILFNEKGFGNVRLQHIADKAFVSVGHLAYHFKSKDHLVLTLYKQLKKKQEQLLTESRVLPLFEDIDLMLHNVYELQQQYRFFYLDTLDVLRAFAEIGEKHRRLQLFQQQQIRFMIDFNFSRGSFREPAFAEHFQFVTSHFCMMMDSWLSYQFIKGNVEASESEFHEDLWAILRPLFTDMGKLEYRQLRNIPDEDA